MKNHGITSCGKDLEDAFAVIHNCKWCTKLQLVCENSGNPCYLSREEMNEVILTFNHYE